MSLILNVIFIVTVTSLLMLIKMSFQYLMLHFSLTSRAVSTNCYLCCLTDHFLNVYPHFIWAFIGTPKEKGQDTGQDQGHLWTTRTRLARRWKSGRCTPKQHSNYARHKVRQLDSPQTQVPDIQHSIKIQVNNFPYPIAPDEEPRFNDFVVLCLLARLA